MRLRYSAQAGPLDLDASDVDTSLSSPDFATLPVVADPDYLVLILDPDQVDGSPEIVYVTVHDVADTTVTVARGQEQAHGAIAGRSHATGTLWHHGPTPGEFIPDYDGVVHDDAGTPLRLARTLATQLDADIEAIDPAPELDVVNLFLAQGAGGAWVSNTGITIKWVDGAPPTLSTTPGNFDMVRLTRGLPDGSMWVGELVAADLTP